jgi:hypothetical protein
MSNLFLWMFSGSQLRRQSGKRKSQNEKADPTEDAHEDRSEARRNTAVLDGLSRWHEKLVVDG